MLSEMFWVFQENSVKKKSVDSDKIKSKKFYHKKSQLWKFFKYV